MNIPSYRRLFKQDFDSKDQPLVERLSYTINIGFETLYQALSNRLSFNDNFNANVKTFQVQVDANGDPVGSNLGFSTTISGNVVGILVINARNLKDSNTYPTTAPFVSFTGSSGSIKINNITGLQANTLYSLTVIAFGS